jgi:hypothetical protein
MTRRIYHVEIMIILISEDFGLVFVGLLVICSGKEACVVIHRIILNIIAGFYLLIGQIKIRLGNYSNTFVSTGFTPSFSILSADFSRVFTLMLFY